MTTDTEVAQMQPVKLVNTHSYIIICDKDNYKINHSNSNCNCIKIPTIFQYVCAENIKQYLECILGMNSSVIDMAFDETNQVSNKHAKSSQIEHLKLSSNDILDILFNRHDNTNLNDIYKRKN